MPSPLDHTPSPAEKGGGISTSPSVIALFIAHPHLRGPGTDRAGKREEGYQRSVNETRRGRALACNSRPQPRPMKGMVVAVTVMNCTFASGGSDAMVPAAIARKMPFGTDTLTPSVVWFSSSLTLVERHDEKA